MQKGIILIFGLMQSLFASFFLRYMLSHYRIVADEGSILSGKTALQTVTWLSRQVGYLLRGTLGKGNLSPHFETVTGLVSIMQSMLSLFFSLLLISFSLSLPLKQQSSQTNHVKLTSKFCSGRSLDLTEQLTVGHLHVGGLPS